jgi:hypothetical protein
LRAVLPDDTDGGCDGYGEQRHGVSGEELAMIDIEDMRKRHANSILNTATGRALGAALDELEELKNLNEGNQNEKRTDCDSDSHANSDR